MQLGRDKAFRELVESVLIFGLRPKFPIIVVPIAAGPLILAGIAGGWFIIARHVTSRHVASARRRVSVCQ